ncbi:MAG TPA: hypothetical protein P5076_12915, partial [Myxococcota bacterium]|nr:hypothetical protein [Myxococcota bacterium]
HEPDIFWDGDRGQFIVVWAMESTVVFMPVDPGGSHGLGMDSLRGRFWEQPRSPAVARASSSYMLVWAEDNTIMTAALDYNGEVRFFDPCEVVDWGQWGETDEDGVWHPWNRNDHPCYVEGWHLWLDDVTSTSNPQDLEILGAGDTFVVVWQEGSGSSHGIRVQRLSYTGGSWMDWYSAGSAGAISGPFTDAMHPVLLPRDGGYLLSFDALKNGGAREAYVVWLSSDGGVVRGPTQVSDSAAVNRNASGAASAMGLNEQVGVFWTERGSDPEDQAHMFRALDAAGAPIGLKPITLAREVWDMGRELRPTGAVYTNGRYGALFTEVVHYAGEPPCPCLDDCLEICMPDCTEEQSQQCGIQCEGQCEGGGWTEETWYGVRFLSVCAP